MCLEDNAGLNGLGKGIVYIRVDFGKWELLKRSVRSRKYRERILMWVRFGRLGIYIRV